VSSIPTVKKYSSCVGNLVLCGGSVLSPIRAGRMGDANL